MRGFYRSRYKAADGSERYLGTTQFEATSARRALPCFDEPALKAVFEVTMVCDPCERMDAIRSGLQAELEGRRGMLARIVAGGELALGDTLELVD